MAGYAQPSISCFEWKELRYISQTNRRDRHMCACFCVFVCSRKGPHADLSHTQTPTLQDNNTHTHTLTHAHHTQAHPHTNHNVTRSDTHTPNTQLHAYPTRTHPTHTAARIPHTHAHLTRVDSFTQLPSAVQPHTPHTHSCMHTSHTCTPHTCGQLHTAPPAPLPLRPHCAATRPRRRISAAYPPVQPRPHTRSCARIPHTHTHTYKPAKL